MAPPKRLRITPLDDPPSSSSSDDDQPPSSKKPEDVFDEEDLDEEDDEDEEEGSSSEEEEEQVHPPSKNPPPGTPISNPKPNSGYESESGSESDSVQEPTPPNAKVKPLASKPMKAQPQAQSTPVPARSGTKRSKPAKKETTGGGGGSENEADGDSSKPAKKKTTGGGGGSENEADGDGSKPAKNSKKMNQRVFSEDDEIAILKGLADFISKTGNDPMKDVVEFHSFVKKSIHADATSEQLKRKVRNLKMKFKDGGSFTKEHDKKAFELSKKVWGNTEGNLKMKFMDGGSFTKEHDKKVFELSKKIWGNTEGNNGGNEGEENGKVNEKTPKSTKKEAPVRNNGSAKKCKFGEVAGLSFNKDAMERGMGLLEESKAGEFEEGWRNAQIAELELFVIRGQLVTDQARITLEAMKKSTN